MRINHGEVIRSMYHSNDGALRGQSARTYARVRKTQARSGDPHVRMSGQPGGQKRGGRHARGSGRAQRNAGRLNGGPFRGDPRGDRRRDARICGGQHLSSSAVRVRGDSQCNVLSDRPHNGEARDDQKSSTLRRAHTESLPSQTLYVIDGGRDRVCPLGGGGRAQVRNGDPHVRMSGHRGGQKRGGRHARVSALAQRRAGRLNGGPFRGDPRGARRRDGRLCGGQHLSSSAIRVHGDAPRDGYSLHPNGIGVAHDIVHRAKHGCDVQQTRRVSPHHQDLQYRHGG